MSGITEFEGKVAFITGAASGIGLGIAKACLDAGMKVAIADVRADGLARAAAALGHHSHLQTIPLDVTDRDAWIVAADKAEAALGPVDLLCSNAGVNIIGPTQDATYEDWDFLLGVNLGGAVAAVRTFAPRMLARGEGGQIVITASVSGLFAGAFSGVYNTTKYALVGLGESLRADLAPHGIGVSVLCPGPVKSELFESTGQVRPSDLALTGSVPVVKPGTSREETPIFATAPGYDEVGLRVLQGVRRNDLYIMTHPEIRSVLDSKAKALAASLPDEPIDEVRVAATQMLLNDAIYAEQLTRQPPKAP